MVEVASPRLFCTFPRQRVPNGGRACFKVAGGRWALAGTAFPFLFPGGVSAMPLESPPAIFIVERGSRPRAVVNPDFDRAVNFR